jgi:hypothetical protein
MIKPTAMEYIIILTALNMKETGEMINNMAKDTRHGPMEASSMGTM